ncbi:hypothetical protein N7474_007131 [Penicillium riverlandense]|uniref:uncharacterized protein n=1 Tax=Penicillium riverlandense TaxID=1903569 RepID=UPI002546A2C2|nr:uncharacterized protein N7474_007131 [Penicillium riverlandense]KAJ5815354.1 hypothetical protein N7474_007131 [Penicillium riverlandense]
MKFLNRLIHPSSNASSSTATGAPNPADNNARPHIHRTPSASSTKRYHDRSAEERTSRHLILVSDTQNVSSQLVHPFQAEGFDVTHLPFGGCGDLERDRKALENLVHEKEDELETGERYAIVAYHRPAYLLLESHHLSASNTNPFPRLCALIAYYPLLSPKSNPTAGNTGVHGHETSQSPEQDDNEEGDNQPACMKTDTIFSPETKATYLPIQIHFAGRRHSEFNNGGCSWPWISAGPEGDVTYKKRHRCYVFDYPEAGSGPALDNGLDDDAIHSRLAWSLGAGQIVDEVQVSFRHIAEIPWLLPGVAPTDRDVQMVIVVVVSFCAGSIASQKVYWDQASVLVQVGLLDGGLVPRMN